MALQFRIAGIPVRIDPSLVLVLGILALDLEDWRLVLAWIGLGVASVLVHELGHAAAFRRFGQNPSISLWAFGGLTRGEAALPPRRSLAVSLAGPIAQLVLVGPLLLVSRVTLDASGFWTDLMGIALFMNIAWPLFNLVPVVPLDGGNALGSVVEMIRPNRGMKVAQTVSVVVAVGGAVVAFSTGFVLPGAFAVLLAYMNLQALRADPSTADDDLILSGYRALIAGDVSTGRLAAVRAGQASPPGATAKAEELRLWSLAVEGDVKRLIRALELSPMKEALSALLRGVVAVMDGRREEGIGLLSWSLAAEPVRPSLPLAADAMENLGVSEDLVDELARIEGGTRGVRLFQAALHHRGHFARAAWAGARLVSVPSAERPVGLQAEIAADVAASSVRAGDMDRARSWLAWAIDNGWADSDRLRSDSDLAPLQGLATGSDSTTVSWPGSG